MEQFNIWDLERVNIRLGLKFIDKINALLNNKFSTKQEAYNSLKENGDLSFLTFKNLLKPSYSENFFVPLRILLNVIHLVELSNEELQENILAYKTSGGINFIEKPILPIKINPVFDMIFAHNIGDGTVINPKKGRLPYFGYRQFDLFYRLAYVRKLEFIFGKIKYLDDYFLKSTRPYCPPVISTLFFKYYGLKREDFLSDRARIPQIIFDKGKDNILAVLIAFIIDEGHIDSTLITINLKNELLIKDLSEICSILGYKHNITQSNAEKETGYARLNILRDGMTKFYSDYLKLNKTYPIIDLGKKGKKIEDSFKIYHRKILRVKGNRDLIFKILREEHLSVNQLATRINMTRQGVRYHIHKLIKQGKIKVVDNNSLNWTYGA